MVIPGAGCPLVLERRAVRAPDGAEVRLRLRACAVCRTDLHVQDAELPDVHYPIVPGHQAVGEIEAAGPQAVLRPGTLVGIAWLASACGVCRFCRAGQENLCDHARFHGFHLDGGYAECMLVDSRFCFPLPPDTDPVSTTPLLCAGLIGFRTLRLAGKAQRIGMYGFGSAAHLITQLARYEGREVYAFTRPGDAQAQEFARRNGAVWAGGSDESAPEALDAALIFAPVGALVPRALRAVRKGGTVVCGGIHMSDIPAFPYADLWEERQLRSVANLTRDDGRQFLPLAAAAGIRPEITRYPLEEANRALDDLRSGALSGTGVLIIDAD